MLGLDTRQPRGPCLVRLGREAVGVALLILSHLEPKIAGNLKRDQEPILAYTALPALFCLTITMQALRRGFDATPAFHGAAWHPRVTMVWTDLEDEPVLFDAAEGSVKLNTPRGSLRVGAAGVATPGGNGLLRPKRFHERQPLPSPGVSRNYRRDLAGRPA